MVRNSMKVCEDLGNKGQIPKQNLFELVRLQSYNFI